MVSLCQVVASAAKAWFVMRAEEEGLVRGEGVHLSYAWGVVGRELMICFILYVVRFCPGCIYIVYL
jgi:hypothetical protein